MAAPEESKPDLTTTPVIYPARPLAESVFVVSIVLTVVATVILALRLWARALLPNKRYGLDDFMAIAAYPFVVGMSAESAVLMRHGYGHHLPEVLTIAPENLVYGLKVLFAGYLTYNCAICLVRISATLFYMRVFANPQNTFKRFVWGSITLNIIWFIGSQLAAIFECNPVYAFWERTTPGAVCLETLNLQLGSGISSVFLDLVALIMPLPMIFKLQLAMFRKIMLLLTFIVGYSVVALSIGRLVTVAKLGNSLNTDITWAFVDVNIWLVLETTVASICISLPSTFSLYHRARQSGWQALFTSKETSFKGYKYDHSVKYRSAAINGQARKLPWQTPDKGKEDDKIPLGPWNGPADRIVVTSDITVQSDRARSTDGQILPA